MVSHAFLDQVPVFVDKVVELASLFGVLELVEDIRAAFYGFLVRDFPV